MKKVLLYIFYLVSIFIIVFNLLSITHLSFFGFRVFKVASGSMQPYLDVNDIIILKSKDKYNVNDVVTYRDNTIYTTHRIISIIDDEIITKGDVNNTQDDPIKKEDILGKVVYKIKIADFINYMFSNTISWILLFLVGLFITILLPNKE